MVRAIVFSAVIAVLAAHASAQLVLTPRESFYEVEGIRFPNVTFRDGAKNVTYSPPHGWKLSGGGARLSIEPPDIIQSGATIQVLPAKESLPLTEKELKVYGERAVSLVPRDAAKVEVVEAVVSALRICGKPLAEVTVTYAFFGQTFKMNVLFLPRAEEEVCFKLIARAADFDALQKAFRTSLYSIEGL